MTLPRLRRLPALTTSKRWPCPQGTQLVMYGLSRLFKSKGCGKATMACLATRLRAPVAEAFAWGFIAASSLLLGALIALRRPIGLRPWDSSWPSAREF